MPPEPQTFGASAAASASAAPAASSDDDSAASDSSRGSDGGRRGRGGASGNGALPPRPRRQGEAPGRAQTESEDEEEEGGNAGSEESEELGSDEADDYEALEHVPRRASAGRRSGEDECEVEEEEVGETHRLVSVSGRGSTGRRTSASSSSSPGRRRKSLCNGLLTTEELMTAVFSSLTAEAEEELKAVKQGRCRDSTFKRNRRRTYLNTRVKWKWQVRSRRFLERRRDAIIGLAPAALYSVALLQHLLELDTADAALPEGQRRFEDVFVDSMNHQFVLDATRARYIVKGETFYFAESPPDISDKEFVRRLTAAITELVPDSMLPRVTTAMCQSGLAALEKASLCHAAVSGGRQDVDYELREGSGVRKELLVNMQVHRHGFGHYILPLVDEPIACHPDSSLRKSASVSFGADGSVDVLFVSEEVRLLRPDGEPAFLGPLLRDPFAKQEPPAPLESEAGGEEEDEGGGDLGREGSFVPTSLLCRLCCCLCRRGPAADDDDAPTAAADFDEEAPAGGLGGSTGLRPRPGGGRRPRAEKIGAHMLSSSDSDEKR